MIKAIVLSDLYLLRQDIKSVVTAALDLFTGVLKE